MERAKKNEKADTEHIGFLATEFESLFDENLGVDKDTMTDIEPQNKKRKPEFEEKEGKKAKNEGMDSGDILSIIKKEYGNVINGNETPYIADMRNQLKSKNIDLNIIIDEFLKGENLTRATLRIRLQAPTQMEDATLEVFRDMDTKFYYIIGYKNETPKYYRDLEGCFGYIDELIHKKIILNSDFVILYKDRRLTPSCAECQKAIPPLIKCKTKDCGVFVHSGLCEELHGKNHITYTSRSSKSPMRIIETERDPIELLNKQTKQNFKNMDEVVQYIKETSDEKNRIRKTLDHNQVLLATLTSSANSNADRLDDQMKNIASKYTAVLENTKKTDTAKSDLSRQYENYVEKIEDFKSEMNKLLNIKNPNNDIKSYAEIVKSLILKYSSIDNSIEQMETKLNISTKQYKEQNQEDRLKGFISRLNNLSQTLEPVSSLQEALKQNPKYATQNLGELCKIMLNEIMSYENLISELMGLKTLLSIDMYPDLTIADIIANIRKKIESPNDNIESLFGDLLTPKNSNNYLDDPKFRKDGRTISIQDLQKIRDTLLQKVKELDEKTVKNFDLTKLSVETELLKLTKELTALALRNGGETRIQGTQLYNVIKETFDPFIHHTNEDDVLAAILNT